MFGGSLGPLELLLIFLAILLIFGATRIPEIARGLGKGIREFKSATREISSELTIDDTPPRIPTPRQPAQGQGRRGGRQPQRGQGQRPQRPPAGKRQKGRAPAQRQAAQPRGGQGRQAKAPAAPPKGGVAMAVVLTLFLAAAVAGAVFFFIQNQG